MKKIEVFYCLFLLILYASIVYSQSGIGAVLEIADTSGPIINIIGPLNNSGDADGNITFSYNTSDANDVDNCSLIINNEINMTDTSITEDTKINFLLNNVAIGSYNWSINCTDNNGYIGSSSNRAFIVSSMKNFNGSTTNISLVDVRDITNFVLEVIPYGKINFSENVDISQGLNVDKYVNITSNRIELNSTALTDLNKPATLSLNNLGFTNPRPLKDGSVCPSNICTEVSYSGGTGTFVFSVTQFTVYSSEETPIGDVGDGGDTGGGGGGGGGGGAATTVLDYTIDRETLKVILKQGQTKEETFKIKNTATTTLDLTISLGNLRNFIFSPTIDEIKVTLNPNEEQVISIVFEAKEDQTPDVYAGKIVIKSAAGEKAINTILEIESAKPLFYVDVEVLPEYKSIYPGDEVFMEVSLFNVRGFGRVDVILEYSIRDFEGNLIAKEEETVAVETQAKFSRKLLVPRNIQPGTYIASVKVTFEDSVGISSDLFEVKAKAIRLYPVALIRDNTLYFIVGGAIIIIVSIFLMYQFYYSRRRYVPKTKEEERKLIQKEEKIQKLKKELKALESAFKSKFIPKESYKKSKERIEKQLRNLKG